MICNDGRAPCPCVRGFAFAFMWAALVASIDVSAQSVSIDSGASWQMDDAVVDLDCAALDVAGALAAGNAVLDGIGQFSFSGVVSADTAMVEVGGDWSNLGSFFAGTSTVRLVDRCDAATASIGGSSDFSTLQIESARGKTYRFPAGLNQSVTQALRLAGAPGVLMPIGSTQPGTQAGIALGLAGSQDVGWIEVSDMAAPEGFSWIAPDQPEVFNSVDAGNNSRWFVPALPAGIPVPVPVNSLWALLVLALGIVLGVRRGLRLC